MSSILVWEAFSDAFIACEAPHGHDFLRPGREGLAELTSWARPAGRKLVDGAQETRHQLFTLSAVAMFFRQR